MPIAAARERPLPVARTRKLNDRSGLNSASGLRREECPLSSIETATSRRLTYVQIVGALVHFEVASRDLVALGSGRMRGKFVLAAWKSRHSGEHY